MLIAIEGIDGSGKTSLAKHLGEAIPDAVFVSRKTLPRSETPGLDEVLISLRDSIWSAHDFTEEPIGAMYWYYKLLAWYHALYEVAIHPRLRSGQTVIVDGWIYRHIIKTAMRASEPIHAVRDAARFLPEPEKVILLEVDVVECWMRRSDYTNHEIGLWDGFTNGDARQNYYNYQTAIQTEYESLSLALGWNNLRNSALSWDDVAGRAIDLVRSWGNQNV